MTHFVGLAVEQGLPEDAIFALNLELINLLLIMMVLLKRQRVEEQQPKPFGTPRADDGLVQWHVHCGMFCC